MSGIRELILFKKVFTENSHEILQYLDNYDKSNLKICNKFLFDICQCYDLLSISINSLSKLFNSSLEISYMNNIKDKNHTMSGLFWLNQKKSQSLKKNIILINL